MTDENGFTYYLMTNYRGDVVKIVDTSGAEAASYTYDPWGKQLSNEPAGKLANQPLRYASYVYDTETALYNLQARYYDSDTARFISRDPDGGDKTNPLSQNLYAYANADPVNNVDPDGKLAKDLVYSIGKIATLVGIGAAIASLLIVAAPVLGLAVTSTLSASVFGIGVFAGGVSLWAQSLKYKYGWDTSRTALMFSIFAAIPPLRTLYWGSAGISTLKGLALRSSRHEVWTLLRQGDEFLSSGFAGGFDGIWDYTFGVFSY